MATFNIQYCTQKRWLGKRDALAKLLGELEADVLCLQEVGAEGLAWIRDRLRPAAFAAVGREDGASAGEHVPVLLLNPRWSLCASGTFWLSPTPERPSVGWGAAHPRICTWAVFGIDGGVARKLAVFNVHLDHRSRRAREESVRLLAERAGALARSAATVICGDFNFRSRSAAYAFLTAGPAGLVDVGLELGSTEPTWDGWTRASLGRARIDYVFSAPELRPLAFEVGNNHAGAIRLSDHRPVVAGFSVADMESVSRANR